jgi:hypothetical protein
MKRAVCIVVVTTLLSSCSEGPRQGLPLPAPLQGETVQQGHLCDASALANAFTHKYPNLDTATADQEVDHLLYLFGCSAAAVSPPPLFATSDTDLQSCTDLQAVTEDRGRYGTPAPPTDQDMLRRCRQSPVETEPVLPVTAMPLPELASSSDPIDLERRGDSYMVPVRINSTITLPFVLDTGAEELVIPADVVLTLIRAGAITRNDFVGEEPYRVANGSEEIGEQMIIRKLQVGQHIANNVTALVSSPKGAPLLGQSFLSRFGSLTLDYRRLVLILSR